MKHALAFALAATFFSSGASALSFPEWGRPLAAQPQFTLPEGSYDFESIVALPNCSGSLVRFDDSKSTDNALVLTNGHCVGMLDPGEVVYNRSANRTFDLLGRSGNRVGKIRTQRVVYATMTKTDAALYELTETYGALEARLSVPALTFSREAPADGTDIEIVSGYWRRGYSCKIEQTVNTLKEGKWTFSSSLRFSRPGCETVGGTSGSPVIAAGTRMVVAVNNTGNESGRRCEVNNPCEVDESGNVTFVKGYSYAQQTYWFYSCRNASGALDLTVPGCALPKPRAWVVPRS